MACDLADLNVLLALFDDRHPFHDDAHTWLAAIVSFATTPITETGLVRLLMQPTSTRNALAWPAAASRLHELKSLSKARFWPDDTSLNDARAITYPISGQRQVTDLHLLNHAASRGERLATFDQKIAAGLKPKDRRHLHLIRTTGC